MHLEDFIKQFPLRRFDKDQLLLVQGERPREVYYVESGFIKGYDINLDGIEQNIWIGGKGDIVPYSWLFSATDSTQIFYSAFTPLEVRVVNKQQMIDFLLGQPEALFSVAGMLAEKISQLTDKLTATEKPKASEKITYMLSILARRYGHADSPDSATELILPLTQQDIANLLGLTRETVATELKKLKDKGYIYYDKWRFVVHQEKLSELM